MLPFELSAYFMGGLPIPGMRREHGNMFIISFNRDDSDAVLAAEVDAPSTAVRKPDIVTVTVVTNSAGFPPRPEGQP